MTRPDFLDLVKAYTDAHGQAFVTSAGDVTDVVNRTSKQFAKDTLCLYSEDITWTLTSSTAKYSLRDTAVFSKRIVIPLRVWIDADLIKQVTSSPDMAGIDSGYYALGTNKPAYWYTQPPNHIILRPAPDQVYSNCRVAGWYLPDDLDIPTYGATEDSLEFPDEVLDCLAIDCAIALMRPRATGDLLERIVNLEKLNAPVKAGLLSEAQRLLQPHPVRRARVSRYGLC